MLPFFIGFAVGGVLIAFILNNIHSSKVKQLEADYETKLQNAIGKVAGKN